MVKNIKKATSQVGWAIIAMAVLLLLGSIFVDDEYQSKSSYQNKKYSSNNSYGEDSYIFYLNETDIGRQRKVTESYPNIELGSKKEQNVIYIGNNFKLNANAFAKNEYSFNVNLNNPQEVKALLVYFTPKRKSGSQDLVIKVEDEIVYSNSARSNEVPILISQKFNKSSVKVTFELDKPKWYQIFNWNKFEVEELKIVEERQGIDNNIKEYNFQLNKDFLERVELNVVVACSEDTDDSKPIRVEVNNYTITDFNVDCSSIMERRITREVPLNILNTQKNEIMFKTTGYYNLGYSFNKIYYNDQDTYKFTINNFNDVIDVIMYGDFDKEVIDLRINSQTMSLRRDEIKSILPYLRFGTNEIKFITKPLEIEEFVIEKNEFYEFED